jgi:hypothetical protein
VSLPAVLYTLSSVPIFASRPFLAAFVTALIARFGGGLPWIGEHSIVVALGASPEWFRSWACLAVLGALAALELLSARSEDLRQLLGQADALVKAAVAMLVALAVIDGGTAESLRAIQKAGLEPESAWALVVGGATWAAAGLRRAVVELVVDVDAGDDLGLRTVLAWAESTWAVVGLLFLVVFPVAALVLSALTTLGIWGVRRRAEAREERAKLPCAGCGTPLRPHAVGCHACGRELDAPRAVGVFGQPRERAAPDRASHAFDLVARKRCPRCAGRLRERAVQQACATCGKVTFASPAEFERYLDVLAARLPRTLLVSAALGAIPLLGVVPGVAYYRLNLVSGLRGYIPPLRGITTRWLVRLIHVLVVVVQPIPLVGAVALPVLCWSTYAIYRRSLAGRARAELAPVAAT